MTAYLEQDVQKPKENNANLVKNHQAKPANSIAWISLPRTGTNYLCKLLQNHNKIESHYEIFHKQKFYAHNRQKTIKYINKKYSTDFLNYQDTNLIKWIHRNPEKLITVLKDLSQGKYFSFKIFPGQLNENLVREVIINDRTIKKVLVKRNLLNVYVSRGFALKLEKWGHVDTSKMKLEINFDEFLRWLNWVNRWYKIFEEELKNTDQIYSSLAYKSLHLQQTDKDKFTYLINLLKTLGIEIDPQDGIADIQDTVQYKKQDKRTNIADKIANYEKFKQKIDKYGLEYLIYD